MIRIRKTFDDISDDFAEFKRAYAKESQNVKKDTKGLTEQGELLTVG